MKELNRIVQIPSYVWTCKEEKCGTSFSIVIMRESNGELSGEGSDWGNPQYGPFCPMCGEKIYGTKDKE